MRHTLYHKLWECLLAQDRFLLTTHARPDPDGWGSELALDYLLRKHSKDCLIFNKDPYISATLQSHDARVYTDEEEFDRSVLRNRAVVSVDNSNLDRVGAATQYIQSDHSNLIVIDHHDNIKPSSHNAKFFMFPKASATTEIIYVLYHISETKLPLEIAEALYTGLVVDSGHFRYGKTSSVTHRVAARLLANQVQPAKISEMLYARFSLARLKARQWLYPNLQISDGGRLVYFAMDATKLQAIDISLDDLDGLIDECFEVREVQIALLFTQRRAQFTRVSCRARAGIDMLNIAEKFGGGGHKTACGISLDMSLDDTLATIVPLFSEYLQKM